MPVTNNTRLLVVDDEEAIVFAFRRYFEKRGFTVVVAGTLKAGLAAFTAHPPAIVFLDIALPDGNGLDALAQMRRTHPELPVVIMTAYGSLEAVTRAVQLRAFDILLKPLDLDQIEVLVRQAAEPARSAEPAPPAAAVPAPGTRIIGESTAIQQLFRRLALVAPTEAAVLITGETGTGKELVARAVHDHSARRSGPFVAVNCGALPQDLVESELFGHVKGAFTGADSDKPGRFATAAGGTLLLDEIGELNPTAQVKLLRFLDDRTVERVGSVKPERLDVRVLAATNRDLLAAVAAGSFRADLYYRLAVVQLELPPLRQRSGDIARLARYFLERFRPGSAGGFSDESLALLGAYAWPGNVRELRNAVEHAAVVAGPRLILPQHLPDTVRFGVGTPETGAAATGNTEELLHRYVERVYATVSPPLHEAALAPLERLLITEALRRTEGNQSAAAELLGLHRNTLRQKLREHGLSGAPET